MENLCSLGESIDPESEFEKKETNSTLADGESDYLLFRNPETGEMISCYQPVPEEYIAYRKVYTPEDIPVLSMQAKSEISGNYFLKDEEEVKQFAQQCNIPFDEILTYTNQEESDYSAEYVYFLELNAPPAEGMLYYLGNSNPNWEFLHTQKHLSSYCNIIACPPYGIEFSEPEMLTAPDGTEWKHISE